MAKTQEIRIPLVPEWANVVRPGDTLIIGLAATDNVNNVAKAMQATMEPLGINVVVLDNVQTMVVARPKGDG
jgi:hypothetical protein